MMPNLSDPHARDRNLLFGVLAVQLHFIAPLDLARAAALWAMEPAKGLGRVLVEMGLLEASKEALVNQLLEVQVQDHGGDTHATLTDFGGNRAVHESFAASLAVSEKAGPTPLQSFGGEPTPELRESEGPMRGERLDDAARITVEHPGRYSLRSEQGRGGIGRVLVAFDGHIGREVALKELLTERSDPGSTAPTPIRLTAQVTSRFLREARITGQLEHPGIVPVYEIAKRADGALFYTMKLVRGETLAEKLKESRSLPDRMKLLSHFLDLCQAVAYAHAKGVIHRDLKPANVMVGEFGETVVLDWGLAKVWNVDDVRAEELEEGLRVIKESAAGETAAGELIGTPSYMSPEQGEGKIDEIDEKSDVWGLGAILYELLAGCPPFVGDLAFEVVGKILSQPLVPVREIEPKAPAELCAIAEKCLKKDPKERYPSARELAEDINRFLSGGLISAYDYSALLLAGHWLKHHWRRTSLITFAILFIILMTNPTITYVYFKILAPKVEFTDQDLSFLKPSVEKAKLFALIEPPTEPGNAATTIMKATHHAMMEKGGTIYRDDPLPYPWFEKVKSSLLTGGTGDPSVLEKGMNIPEVDAFLEAGRIKDFRMVGVEFFPEFGENAMDTTIPNYLHMIRLSVLAVARARALENQGRAPEAREILADLLRIGDHLEQDVFIGMAVGTVIKVMAAREMGELLARTGEPGLAAQFFQYQSYEEQRRKELKVVLYDQGKFLSSEQLKTLIDNKDLLPAARAEYLVQFVYKSQGIGLRQLLGMTAEDWKFLNQDHFEDPGWKYVQWLLVSDARRGFFFRYRMSNRAILEFIKQKMKKT